MSRQWYKVKCKDCGAMVRKKSDTPAVCKHCREMVPNIMAQYDRQRHAVDTVEAILDRDYSPDDRLGPEAWSESIDSLANAAYWHFIRS